MNKTYLILLSLIMAALTASTAVAKEFADEPLVVKTKPVPPNVLLLMSRSGTMNGQQTSGGGPDTFYAPGYDPDIRFECPKSPNGWSYDILQPDDSKVLVAYMATALGLTGNDDPYKLFGCPDNTANCQAPAGFPFFKYGSGNYYVFGNNIHKGKKIRTYRVENIPVCFDPDANYRTKLWAAEPENLEQNTYAKNGPERVVTGNFLNWYYSDTPSKWANQTVDGGLGYDTSEKLYTVGSPDYNFVLRGDVGILNKASCIIRHPVPAAAAAAESYSYSIGGNSGCFAVVPAAVPPSPLPGNSIGLKKNVGFITERWSVARDVVKKVVRDAENINLAIATFTTTAAADQKNGSPVLRLESDFNYYSGDNSDPTQVALKENVIQDVNDLAITRVSAHRSPTGSAVLAGANLIFKGWSIDSDGNAVFNAARQTGPDELGATTFNVSGQKGGSGRAGAVTEENWCQKNAIVVLTDGLSTSEKNLLNSNNAINSYIPQGVDETDFTALSNSEDVNRMFSGLLFFSCPKCDKNLVRILGRLYDGKNKDQDWLPGVKGKQNIESYIVAFGSEDMLKDQALNMAGYAGGGGKSNFYPANDGNQLSKAFNDIMARVKSDAASLTAVAASTVPDRNINNLENAYAVQATYDTEYWSGELRAFKMTLEGELVDALDSGVKSASSAGITPVWEAGQVMNQQYLLPNSTKYQSGGVKARNVYTYNSKGIRFIDKNITVSNVGNYFNQLSDAMKADINRMGGSSQERYNTMMYLAGDISNEADYPNQSSVKPFRNRGVYADYDEDGKIDRVVSGGMLGDITNSSPVYVKEPARKWDEPGYKDYYEKHKNRTPMIYVGSNRGFLHAFTVEGDTSGRYPAGSELFAYMPSMLADKPLDAIDDNWGFAYLANQQYEHKFMVDLTPTVSDVYMDFYTDIDAADANPEWRTILVGGLRSGGKGLFALDITCPFKTSNGSTCDNESFTERNVLWEFSAEDDNDLGYTFSQPIIAKVNYDLPNASDKERNGNGNGRWAAVVSNGYHSETGRAALFIIFLDGGLDGTWTAGKDYVKIIVGDINDNASNKNGLSEPVAVDLDNDGIVDHIYAGDLKGRMWTFDVRTNILYEE